MVKSLSPNNIVALQNARTKGLIIRDMISIRARLLADNSIGRINMWTGAVATNIPVVLPDGSQTTRLYQPGDGWLRLPPIPSKLDLEVRTIRMTFSRLPEAVINAVRAYDLKLAKVEIHRGYFDPESMNIFDPAWCRFDGFINQAPITVPGDDGAEGTVSLEMVSSSRYMTRTNGVKFSDEFYKKRRSGDRFCRYVDVAGLWTVQWGGESAKIGDSKPKKPEKFIR